MAALMRLAVIVLVVPLTACSTPVIAAVTAVAGAIASSADLDVKVIDLYLAAKGMKTAPVERVPAVLPVGP